MKIQHRKTLITYNILKYNKKLIEKQLSFSDINLIEIFILVYLYNLCNESYNYLEKFNKRHNANDLR